jgi:hypothetical protein
VEGSDRHEEVFTGDFLVGVDRETRQYRARLGGLALAAMYRPEEYTVAGLLAAERRFLEQVDPTGELRKSDPQEAERRAEAARKAFFVRLSRAGTLARRAKRNKRSARVSGTTLALQEDSGGLDAESSNR